MKRCARCGLDKPLLEYGRASKASGSELYSYCNPCRKLYSREYRQRLQREDKERFERHKAGERKRASTDRRVTRSSALEAYGGCCACCGEVRYEFLAIDHIHNDGAAHRRSIKATTSTSIYRWLKKNGYPEGFQVLCHNCNLALGFYGYCPHNPEFKRDVIRRPVSNVR